MILIDKLQSDVQKLPANLQQEVADFVEFLLAKVEQNSVRQEESEWYQASISYMMQRMDEEEGEEAPVYTLSDVKVRYQ